ncbi:F-box domain-containing protein [Orpheovirus IHUMI-LCC2]|uniref:F-box domain-containing protein n=1 Tax=Orpheovirus IHUMI-LCC2 TaxID=2023057 RepID=A0A2I2L3M4_9VIRU|nr:F-box domain-containing protein [Orpheovirus IHUMI-LCC2]SNW62126.1 F-box domain-containing protein [Orpheovirus IHUMI-LCC2]
MRITDIMNLLPKEMMKEMINNILLYVNHVDINNITVVNKLWNTMMKDGMHWREKLKLFYGKSNRGNEQSWRNRYIMEQNLGDLVLTEYYNGKNNYKFKVGDEYIKGKLLPIKCIYAISCETVLYYITEDLNLYKYDIETQISSLIEVSVSNIEYYGYNSILYIKNGNIYIYGDRKMIIPTIGYVKLAKIMHILIKGINVCYKNDRDECYLISKVEDGWNVKGLGISGCEDIIGVLNDFIILDEEGPLFSVNNSFSDLSKSWLESNPIDKVWICVNHKVYIKSRNGEIRVIKFAVWNVSVVTSYKIEKFLYRATICDSNLIGNRVFKIEYDQYSEDKFKTNKLENVKFYLSRSGVNEVYII